MKRSTDIHSPLKMNGKNVPLTPGTFWFRVASLAVRLLALFEL